MIDKIKGADRLNKIAGTEFWIFDLDNTLYPASSNLFAQIDAKMKDFIAQAFDIPVEDAYKLQKKYYHEYGTTLRGLMVNDGIDPDIFLSYVHNIDHSVLNPDKALDRALDSLCGQKFIYTNGSAKHATAVTNQLGISHHFAAIFDISASDYIPKPDPASYANFVARHAIAPNRAVMFEDSHKNLKPAADLGMTTVFVHHANNAPTGAQEMGHCHYLTYNLVSWLQSANTYIARS